MINNFAFSQAGKKGHLGNHYQPYVKLASQGLSFIPDPDLMELTSSPQQVHTLGFICKQMFREAP